MKVKKNDTVVVITGKDVKKTGKVLTALPKLNKVVVEGVNVQEKNRKARSAQETSQKVKQEGPIDASNVLVICPVCGKATRVGYVIVDGKKVRACKKCGASLDVKVEKKEPAKKTTAKKTTKKVAEGEVAEAPKKTRTKKAETAETVEEVKEVKKTSRKKAVKEEKTENAEA
ncbi:MAG: 50S ribosomal protein L24 [Clostridia bacterium]|nr:50S ribosomal protein L24 [Clostridia bacterium]